MLTVSNTSPAKVDLLTAPVELAGNWGRMIPHSADVVVELMRRACLDDVRLVSDRQPARLRVDEHPSGPPAVWLHADQASTAWVIVDIGQQAWSQLAYQFGHELGHVLANSWQASDQPGPPCQWLEEALVESFSLRGLGRLAKKWGQTPPFPGDNAYGRAIAQYQQDVVRNYQQLAVQQGAAGDFAAWFTTHKADIERGGLIPYGQAAASVILAQYEHDPACVEALGALNRWPGRTKLAIADYLHAWRRSCSELGASESLPAFLGGKLHLS